MTKAIPARLLALALLVLAACSLFLFKFATAKNLSPLEVTPRGLIKTRDQASRDQRHAENPKDAPHTLPKTEVASFAAGCFWGVEQEFRKQKGVVATAVGFMGGKTKNPTYKQVCDENTGHAETVQVEYDPKVVSYAELLDLFWHLHNPTTLNRQGPDVGDQYRSVIFYHSPEQKAEALASKKKLEASHELDDRIVTEIVPSTEFWKAEDYHQQYVEKGGRAACHIRRKKKS